MRLKCSALLSLFCQPLALSLAPVRVICTHHSRQKRMPAADMFVFLGIFRTVGEVAKSAELN